MIYSIEGFQVFGVQSSWRRKPIRTNNDGTVNYSPVLSHKWTLERLDTDIFDSLQLLRGNAVSNLFSNHINEINQQSEYSGILKSVQGKHNGLWMENVIIEFDVGEQIDAWWWVEGIDPSQILVVYQPLGAVNINTSLVNLANPGVNDASAGVLPPLDTRGWVFGGTQWLDTGLPFLKEYSILMRVEQPANNLNKSTCGVIDTTDFWIRGNAIDTGANISVVSTFQYMGFAGSQLNKTIPLGQQPDIVHGIFNTSLFSQSIFDQQIGAFPKSVVAADNTATCYIGARNNASVAEDHFVGTILAVAIYQGAISALQAQQISAQMAAL